MIPAAPKAIKVESAAAKKDVAKEPTPFTTESSNPKDAIKEIKADVKSKGKEGKKEKDPSKVKEASKPKEVKVSTLLWHQFTHITSHSQHLMSILEE